MNFALSGQKKDMLTLSHPGNLGNRTNLATGDLTPDYPNLKPGTKSALN
jgi:hypothetical protein